MNHCPVILTLNFALENCYTLIFFVYLCDWPRDVTCEVNLILIGAHAVENLTVNNRFPWGSPP